MEPRVTPWFKAPRRLAPGLPLLAAGFWLVLIGWWTLGFTAFTATSHTFRLAGPLPRQAPLLALVDHQGRSFSLAGRPGSYRLVYFHFLSCHQVCPLLHSRHLDILRALPPAQRARLELLAISVDPADSPALLRDHLAHLEAPPNMVMARLDGPQPQALRALGVSVVRKPDGSYNHPAFSLLISPSGQLIRMIDGNTPPQTAARQLAASMMEARP